VYGLPENVAALPQMASEAVTSIIGLLFIDV
jgi:hypothetical protein